MLLRFDPFREFDELFNSLSRTTTQAARSFPMDAFRRGEEFVVRFDLPGVDPSAIDVTVEKNELTVKAERTWEPAEGDEVLAAERPRGTFTRRLFLGDTLDGSRLEASYDNGVLTLTIPVAEAAKPRRVEIKRGAGATAIETTSSETAAA